MSIPPANLFADIPAAHSQEVFEHLAGSDSVRIERIVSMGQVTPAGNWYDQQQHEWVAVLQGAATIEFASGEEFNLVVGSYLTIAPHVRHRVAWTKPDTETIWLAVHY